MSDSQCEHAFRFDKAGLDELSVAMRMPESFQASNRTNFSRIEGLCVLFRRLAYPNRLEDRNTYLRCFEEPSSSCQTF